MSLSLVIATLTAYMGALFLISLKTSQGADEQSFFSGNKKSPWYLVAYGMIGASLSGVTFVSVPGWVYQEKFGYMQMVMGYMIGYLVIAGVLMPLYYRLNLVSIYAYLEERFGYWSYKTGAAFFLLARTTGSAMRLYLVANVLQIFLFDELGIHFGLTVFLSIALIWLYTYKGGIKTVVWTDVFQTTFMLSTVGITVWMLSSEMSLSVSEAIGKVAESPLSQVFFFEDAKAASYFWKQLMAGAFMAIVMTGLDQDMMQKNLTCINIKQAQTNMLSFSFVLFFVNLSFMAMGALLFLFLQHKGIEVPARTDDVFPMIAKEHLGAVGGIVFLLGILAAAYSSADSALTALTTSFCVDFLNFNKSSESPEVRKKQRMQVHLAMSALLFLMIIGFRILDSPTIIKAVFDVAKYTYGPLLGLYAFGIFTTIKVKDRFVPWICVASPLLSYVLNANSKAWLGGYAFGFELLLVNGAITMLGLLIFREKQKV